MMSSGVPIQRSTVGAKSTPKTVISAPESRLKTTLVWMARESFSSSSAPK